MGIVCKYSWRRAMNNKTKLIIACIAIAVSATLWGLDGVAFTPQLFNLDTAFIVFMLHLIPFILMNTFLFKEYKQLAKFTLYDYVVLFLIALFGGALGTLAIVKALMLVHFKSLSIVVLLQKLQPVFAITLAAILLKEKLKKNFVLWAAIAIIAGYTLTFGLSLPNMASGKDTAYAAIYAIVAAFAFGSATVFGRMALLRYHFSTITFYRFGFTAFLMFFYVAIVQKFQFAAITRLNWFFFILIAFTTGGGAIFLYYYGLRSVKASWSTILELFFPISAIFFDYVINHHVLTLVQWISAIIMVAAIMKLSMDSMTA